MHGFINKVNHGLDNVLLALSPLALKIGLILGTVSLLLGGILAQSLAFQWTWAIIQAVGVDSCFLITARLFLKASWRSWDKLTFGVLSVLYGSVGLLALNIVSYQELKASSLASAMMALNIDLGVFTTLRSIVIVGTIGLFYLIEDRASVILSIGSPHGVVHHVTAITEQPQPATEQDEQTKVELIEQGRTPNTNSEQVRTNTNEQARTAKEKAIEYLQAHPTATVREVANYAGISSTSTASKYINDYRSRL